MISRLRISRAALIVSLSGIGVLQAERAEAAVFTTTSVSFGSGQSNIDATRVQVNSPRSGFGYQYVQNGSGVGLTPGSQTSRINIGTGSWGSYATGGISYFYRASASVTGTLSGGDASGRIGMYAARTFLSNTEGGSTASNYASLALGSASTYLPTFPTQFNQGYNDFPAVRRYMAGSVISASSFASDGYWYTTLGGFQYRGPEIAGAATFFDAPPVTASAITGSLIGLPAQLDRGTLQTLSGSASASFARALAVHDLGQSASPFFDRLELVSRLIVNGTLVSSSTLPTTSAFSNGDAVASRSLTSLLSFADVDLSSLSLGTASIQLEIDAVHRPFSSSDAPLAPITIGTASWSQSVEIIPTPGAAALLGLCGLMTSRRRRS